MCNLIILYEMMIIILICILGELFSSSNPLSHRNPRSADVKSSNKDRKQFSTDRVGRRLTAYACEDSRLNISCGNELYLDIIRANYGRFSITICNDHGNTDWKVDCQAGRTLRAMQAR